MWDLPGPGLEPVFPALAGGFWTTAPPGKSLISTFFCHPLFLKFLVTGMFVSGAHYVPLILFSVSKLTWHHFNYRFNTPWYLASSLILFSLLVWGRTWHILQLFITASINLASSTENPVCRIFQHGHTWQQHSNLRWWVLTCIDVITSW